MAHEQRGNQHKWGTIEKKTQKTKTKQKTETLLAPRAK